MLKEMERKRIERHELSEEGWLRVVPFSSRHLGNDVFVFGKGNRRIAWDPKDQVVVFEYEHEV